MFCLQCFKTEELLNILQVNWTSSSKGWGYFQFLFGKLINAPFKLLKITLHVFGFYAQQG